MTAHQDKLPGPFDFQETAENKWSTFTRQFNTYLIANELTTKPEIVKWNLLLLAAGPEAQDLFEGFDLENTDDNPLTLERVSEAFRIHCEGKELNVIYERFVFNERKQKETESFNSFLSSIKQLAKSCKFGDLKNELIRDRIICGLKDPDLKKLLLKKPNLTLEKAVDICKIHETTTNQVKKMDVKDDANDDDNIVINAIDQGKKQFKNVHTRSFDRRKSYERYDRNRKPIDTMKNCNACGYMQNPNNCFAYGKRCNYCKKLNHFTAMCKMKRNNYKIRKITDDDEKSVSSDSDDSHFMGSLIVSSVEKNLRKKKANTIKIKINGKSLKVKADTGAEASILPLDTFEKIKLPCEKIRRTSSRLKGFFGPKIRPEGKISLQTSYQKEIKKLNFFVVKGTFTPILSEDACITLGILKYIGHVMSEHSSLLDDSVIKKFKDRFSGKLGTITNGIHLEIDESVKPVIHPPRRLPLALCDPVKEKLQEMVKDQVIVAEDNPTDWVNSMVVVDKRKNKANNEKIRPQDLRICIDPKDLNKALKRPHYPMKTVDEISAKTHGAKMFSKLDAQNGYWQVKLDEESSKLTTFNTPWGRYRFLRLPFGISPAAEIFQRVMSEMFSNIDGVDPVVDDIIIYGKNQNEHDEILTQTLETARQNGLTFNLKKTELRKSEIIYLGHKFTSTGILPDDNKIRAIMDFPTPSDKKGVQRFLGMVQYLHKFIPNLTDLEEPLRELCKEKNMFQWSELQEKTFQILKKKLCESPVLAYYNPNKKLLLSVDSSSHGLGACLMQDGNPIAYASKALTDCQKRYAQIEKELLAIKFGVEKFHTYIYGHTVTVESDHKPLEAIFCKSLCDAPPRLQRMLLALQKYNLEVKYKKGNELFIADALSRAHLDETGDDDDIFYVNIVTQSGLTNKQLEEIKENTLNDPIFQKLKEQIINGWDTKDNIDSDLLEYWQHKESLVMCDDIIMKNHQILIPQNMRRKFLNELHKHHQGISKTLSLARQHIFWPRISAQIKDFVNSCSICKSLQNEYPSEPLIPHDIPNGPWIKIGIDIFCFDGKNYLMMVDYYSKFFEYDLLTNLSSLKAVEKCKIHFFRYGNPLTIISDNGTQFTGQEFKDFTRKRHINHITSSPKYSQSNGLAERTIQTCKNMLKKCKLSNTDPYEALLLMRSTPLDTNLPSPGQLMFNRQLRTSLPMITYNHSLKNTSSTMTQLKRNQLQMKRNFDRSSKSLPSLKIGTKVFFRKAPSANRISGKIVNKLDKQGMPRSYMVKDLYGNIYRRNRRDFVECKEENKSSKKIRFNKAKFIPEIEDYVDINENYSKSRGDEIREKRVQPPRGVKRHIKYSK